MLLSENQTPSPLSLAFPGETPWRGRNLLWMSIAMLAGIVVGSAILAVVLLPSSLTGDDVQITTGYMLGVLAMQAAVMLACIYGFGMARQRIGWRSLGLAGFSGQVLWQALGIALLLRVGVAGLAYLLMQVGVTSQQAAALAPEGFSWPGAIGMILLAGIAVPIAEEIFFRGMLYRWMRSRWSLWLATGISSLLFALIHVELATVIPAFFIGVVCAYSFERSRTLWLPILIHCFNNLIAVGLLYGFLVAGVPVPGVTQ